MYKSILVILLVGMLAIPAMAQVPEPPANGGLPGGWGNNPNNWSLVTDEFCDWTKGIWNPVDGSWTICYGETMCQEITVELWIELFASMTIYDLVHQIHTISDVRDYREFCGYIRGYTASNHPLDILLEPGMGQSLGFLEFQHSVLDGHFVAPRDIPLSWWVAYGYGDVGQAPDPGAANYRPIGEGDDFDIDESYTMPYIESPCDWWWYFKFCFRVYYHEDDGYYVLWFSICPVPQV